MNPMMKTFFFWPALVTRDANSLAMPSAAMVLPVPVCQFTNRRL